MTTAAIAGTGLTATVQGRTLKVEVVDNNSYNVTVCTTSRLVGTRRMTEKSGTYALNIPEGNDYIEVIATNILTGEVEVITLRVE